MNVVVLDAQSAWADAIAALPVAGPLPTRTVLVPSERHAHALRRALVRGGRGGALAGTRFVGPLTAALEVLRTAGAPFSPGEDALRPARLLALFREDLPLEHFDLALLRTTRGWEAAFAAAIRDVEAAGLSPSDLPAETAAARDLARLWARVDADAGGSLSAARIYGAAAAALARDGRAWPFDGPALAVATGWEDAVAARFVRAIPGVTLALRVARPVRARLLQRIETFFGREAREAVERAAGAVAAPSSERDLLAAYLFAEPRVLAAPDRPRSAGPDGTVDLEEHAGVDAELEATAAWVSRQVLEARRPLEEIAVLVAAQDPLAQLVAERIGRVPFEGGSLPVYVAGGVPAVADAAGARVLAVVRALGAYLAADALAAVLPSLRLVDPAPPGPLPPALHLSHGEAMELAFGLGTVGGNAAYPEGALAWSARAAVRISELEAALRRARTDEDSAAREARRLERTLRNLRAARPALDALVGVARAAVGREPLAQLWAKLSAFLRDHVLLPGEGAAIPARLAESLGPACADALGSRLCGQDALDVVHDELLSMRIPRRRFGEPAVYVGTVQGASGLEFAAVRVVGLCEGVLPSHAREDPVVPERMRAALERAAPGRVLPRADDRTAAQVHALFTAIGGARDAVALSAPRVDLVRTEREPASLFVDAAAALARPNASNGEPADPVPGTTALARDYFRPAGAASAAFRAARPVSGSVWLDRVARVAAELPRTWSEDPVLALPRVAALRAPGGKLGPADGVLGPGDPFPPVPGVGPDRPISASALQQLLQCPRMFLMRRILYWDEPAAAPSLRELDAVSFGSLLHRVVETFYRAHGAELVSGERSLPHWQDVARAVADREFDAFLSEYPLVGEGVRKKERGRLRDAVESFLAYDWGAKMRTFHAVELAFGKPRPLAISAGGVTLYTSGYIDRVDVEGGATLVRDLKSGKAHPRVKPEEDPTPVRDVQLGLYLLAARQLAGEWKTPGKVEAAYAYASGRSEVVERSFRDDPGALEEATKAWLATAAHLLAARAFPPTADEGDCEYCPFQPLCGASAPRRAREGLAEEEDGPLVRFRELKLGDGGEE